MDLAGDSISFEVEDSSVFQIHNGILKVVSRISAPEHRSLIYNRIKDLLLEYQDYSLTLTGHSLGAAIASVLSVLWADPATGKSRPESGFRSCTVRVFAYACPSVMDLPLAEKCKTMITTVVIGWDWLARVSLSGITDIRDASIRLRTLVESDSTILDAILNNSCTPTQVQTLYELRKDCTKNAIADPKRLYPPGKIFWIYHAKDDPTRYVIYKVLNRAKIFGQIIFDDKMLKDHQPDSYVEVLQNRVHIV